MEARHQRSNRTRVCSRRARVLVVPARRVLSDREKKKKRKSIEQLALSLKREWDYFVCNNNERGRREMIVVRVMRTYLFFGEEGGGT